MIIPLIMPDQESELIDHLAENPVHHVWKDVPNAKVIVFTGDDMPQEE